MPTEFDTDTVVIIGSQAILLGWPDPPPMLTHSPEIDAFPGSTTIWETREKPKYPERGLAVDEASEGWRRGRDSNPRYGCPYAAFRVRCDRPLCHLSGGVFRASCGEWESGCAGKVAAPHGGRR